jgi:hypothetical protein
MFPAEPQAISSDRHCTEVADLFIGRENTSLKVSGLLETSWKDLGGRSFDEADTEPLS